MRERPALLMIVAVIGASPIEAAPISPTQPDTLWFGGRNTVTGLAMRDSVWTFEEPGVSGWTSVDRSDEPLVFWTHVTADSHAVHGDPRSCVITAGGSTGSIWIGAHEDYATEACWAGGQGYGNDWNQRLRKSFAYDGSGDVTLSFDYFVDIEESFDLVYVYVGDSNGPLGYPLNTSLYPDNAGWGYAGSSAQGSPIGSPTTPAHESIVVPGGDLSAGMITVTLALISDDECSDERDACPALIDTDHGAFGVDNIHVAGGGIDDLSDFEPGRAPGDELDGWSWEKEAAAGRLMKVADLADLDPPDDPTNCPLEGRVLLASEIDSLVPYHHPRYQHELLVSNVVADPELGEFATIVVEYDSWEVLGGADSLDPVYRVMMHYYPWTCPETGEVGWTLQAAGNHEYRFLSVGCDRRLVNLGGYLPNEPEAIDSVRVVFELRMECPFVGICHPFVVHNQSPYWDNVRVGVVRSSVIDVEASGGDSAPLGPVGLLPVTPTPARVPLAVEYVVTGSIRTSLTIHDASGRLVRWLHRDALQKSGRHVGRWDGRDEAGRRVSPGVYFLRLEAAGASNIRKLVLGS